MEYWAALTIWFTTVKAYEELCSEFRRLKIANVCSACGRLYTNLSLQYCSSKCSGSTRSAKHYKSNADKLRPMKRSEAQKNRKFLRNRRSRQFLSNTAKA